jgi:hypothetical protein
VDVRDEVARDAGQDLHERRRDHDVVLPSRLVPAPHEASGQQYCDGHCAAFVFP